MLTMVQNDNERTNALVSCSPRIAEFIRRIDAKDPIIKWERLERDGCKQKDGSFFRVVSTVRTATQQINEYKRGRKDVVSDAKTAVFPNEYCKNTPATHYILLNRGLVKKKKEVSTNAWAGESYHNWGLALDFCIRKFGDDKIIELSDGAMSLSNYYKMIGLVDLAKDCGLSWGGDWVDFEDTLHFEDKNYKIPETAYHYDKNMNFAFIDKFNEVKEVKAKTSLKPLILAIASIFGLKKMGVIR